MIIQLLFASLLVVTSRALPQNLPYGYGYQIPASSNHPQDYPQTALASEQYNNNINNNINNNNNNNNNYNNNNNNKYLPPATTTPSPIVHKHFYVVGPAEDQSDNEPKIKRLVLGQPQKNYRVLFIKAPSADNANTKYIAEQAPNEEKTVIYVLSKKAEDLQSSDIATPTPTTPSKPEVFFIKYKTEEEAAYAQKEIQGQYDQLGGTNEFSSESAAPITSIVGSLDGLNADGSYDYKVISKDTVGSNSFNNNNNNNSNNENINNNHNNENDNKIANPNNGFTPNLNPKYLPVNS